MIILISDARGKHTMMIDQEQAVQLTIKKGVDCWNMQLHQQRGGFYGEKGEKLGGPSFCPTGRPPPAIRDEPQALPFASTSVKTPDPCSLRVIVQNMAGSEEAAAGPANKRPHSEVDAADNGECKPPVPTCAPQPVARSRLTTYTLFCRR